jgi:hypothetical protein
MSRIFLVIIAVFSLTVIGTLGRAQQQAEQPQDYTKLGAPGPEHKHLQALVGTWILSMDGTEKKGRTEFKSIWDGRFVTEEAKLPFGGFDWEWRGFYGYDKHKKKYTAFWVDNMDTNTESADGYRDQTGKVLAFYGHHYDPRGDDVKYCWRILFVSDDRIDIQMLDVDKSGKETPVISLHGERLKPQVGAERRGGVEVAS